MVKFARRYMLCVEKKRTTLADSSPNKVMKYFLFNLFEIDVGYGFIFFRFFALGFRTALL